LIPKFYVILESPGKLEGKFLDAAYQKL
jgi:hypothetical protein